MKKLNLNLIYKKRKAKQITLQEMAETMGLKNASTYMKYEKGEYSFRAEHLPILAKTLNCEIQDLFFEDRLAKLANTKRKEL